MAAIEQHPHAMAQRNAFGLKPSNAIEVVDWVDPNDPESMRNWLLLFSYQALDVRADSQDVQTQLESNV